MRQCFLFLILVGCGYHLDYPPDCPPALSLAEVRGDEEGRFTAALVSALAANSWINYSSCAPYQLIVEMVDGEEEQIGFRYDRSRKGRLRHFVIPVEARMTLMADVVVQKGSGQCIAPAVRLMAQVDYDHDYYTLRDGINSFSLGQLTDVDEARTAAQELLYQQMAHKISAYVQFLVPSF